MAIAEFVLDEYGGSDDWKKVTAIGKEIEGLVTKFKIEIDAANMPGKSSRNLERIFEPHLSSKGFVHEPKKEYENRLLCPDFVNREMKVIIEIERGKILNNNMDMLDFWKTHIHGHCRYLILMVPLVLKHSEKSTEHPFEKVRTRMDLLFSKDNRTNVRGLVLIGY